MKKLKSFAVLAGVVILSLALLSLASTSPLHDGRYLLTACCLLLAEAFVWAAATNRPSGEREFNRVAPFYLGMEVLAGINLLLSLIEVWLYLDEASYTALVVVTGLIFLFFVIGTALMLSATRSAAQGERIYDDQHHFMHTLRTNLTDLAERVRTDSAQGAAVKKGFDRLCEEARYTSLQSPPGTEKINDELAREMAALESGCADSARTLQQLALLEAVLKRRENIIRQIKG